MASKQRNYQKRHEALGLCVQCRSLALSRRKRCFRHQVFYYLRERGLTKGVLKVKHANQRERLVATLMGRYHAIVSGFLEPGDDAQRLKDAVEIRARLKVLWAGMRGALKLAAVMGSLDRHALRARKEKNSGPVEAAR